MNFDPDPEQQLIAETARAFAERELAPKAADRDRTHAFPEAEMRRLGALGLLGVTVPAALGGSEAGPIALALAVREVARADASVAVTMSVTNMVAEIIATCGTDDARRAHLPRLCSGEAVAGAFALSEAQAGSDPRAMTTTVERAPQTAAGGAGYLIRGNKLWTTSGDRAGVLIVAARHGASMGGLGYSAFVIGAPAPGLTAGKREWKMGQRGSSTMALHFDEVAVPASALLSGEGEGLRVALAGLGSGRIGIAALSIGIAQAALAVALAHVRERRQFGVPLADQQAIRFHLADSATGIEAAWLSTMHAAWRKQQGLSFVRQACQAKLLASERAVEICDRAVQMLGGYGYTREFPVERHYRDVRVTTLYEGTSEIQRLVIARELLRESRAGRAPSPI
ncbi:MAG TPA: acyl-CoA dehydrogenase family protein [Polyangia bacterium]|nr:acyl-CoA dehydrogenase family protein [Polyangia bacterium]